MDKNTQKFLDSIDYSDPHATWGAVGQLLQSNPDKMQKMIDDGVLITDMPVPGK